MNYKKFIYLSILTIISTILLYSSTIYVINRINYFIEIGTYQAFYDSPAHYERFDIIVNDVKLWFDDFWNNFIDLIFNLLSFIFNEKMIINLSFIIQIYIIIKILLSLWLDNECNKYYISKYAKALIKVIDYISLTFNELKEFTINNKKRFILTFGFISGVFPVLIFEGLFVLFDYLLAFITFESHIFLFNIFKWAVVFVLDFVMYGNKFLLITIIITLYIFLAHVFAWNKLRSNWKKFMKMIKDAATLNFFEGEPGAGKTLSIAQATLASQEVIIKDFEKDLIEFEITHPDINMAYIRLLFKILFLDFKEDELDNIIKYYDGILFDLFRFNSYQSNDICRIYFSLYYRGTAVISFIPMIDPYQDSYSRIGDVQTLRFFKELSTMPYEPGVSIMYPEIDKEFNSHDHISEIGDDGTHAAFALLSHLLERHGNVFMDAQIPSQLAKRIRGIAGEYYHLEYKQVKLPFMMNTIYKPILRLYNGLLRLILAYLGEKPKTEKKWTVRRKAIRFKRNNVGLLYQCMKYTALLLNKMVSHFERFQYFKIYAKKAYNDEMKDAEEITYNLNVMDFFHKGNKIYNSTQFKNFYEELRNDLATKKGIKQNVCLLEKWTSLDTTIAEYSKSHQRLLQRVIDAQTPAADEKI